MYLLQWISFSDICYTLYAFCGFMVGAIKPILEVISIKHMKLAPSL